MVSNDMIEKMKRRNDKGLVNVAGRYKLHQRERSFAGHLCDVATIVKAGEKQIYYVFFYNKEIVGSLIDLQAQWE